LFTIGVDVEHQTRPVPATGRAGRQVPAGIGAQQPGPFPGLCAGVADPRQRGIVDRVQHPPRGRGRRDRTEHGRLVPQHPPGH
jgi:hypothetical protein